MPINWKILRDEELVEINVLPDVKLDDIRSCYATLIDEGAVPYRKLIDLTFAALSHGGAGIRALGERAQAVGKTMPLGPVAVVVASELAIDLVAEFARQVSLNRPLQVFRNAKVAKAWLMQQPTGRNSEV